MRLTRELLRERVWGYDYLGDSRLVDLALKRHLVGGRCSRTGGESSTTQPT